MPDSDWWRPAVIYQIYPRSFADGNGDGIGDLWGVIDRLDYLADLGVDAVWLSPHYPSPNADWGYDVADYTDVHPEYGDLDLFVAFLAAAHARGIRVLLDLVMNHTSDRHPWFLDSRSSATSGHRDWYVWHPGRRSADGTPQPPNNWLSIFGGPAWTFDETTGEWYYHFFLEEQPDLNWHNPAVRRAMWQSVRFWLDMGVDGFRLDAIGTLFEAPDLADHTAAFELIELVNERFEPPLDEDERLAFREMFGRQTDLAEVHDVMRELRAVVDEYGDRVLIGETDHLSYHGTGSDELHLVFNFPLMDTRRLTAGHVRDNQRKRLGALPPGAWPCTTFGNHDAERVRSRFADGTHDLDWARMAAALVMLLPGTASLYQGEEIGMENLIIECRGEHLDPIGPWYYREAIDKLGMAPSQAARRAAHFSRDRSRSPMQWTSAPNAGFCPPEATPWLPVHPNHATGVNVEAQRGDRDSLLEWYRALITLRHEHAALGWGGYEEIRTGDDDVLAFARNHELGRCIVVINLSPRRSAVAAPSGRPLLLHRAGLVEGDLVLGPFGIMVTGR